MLVNHGIGDCQGLPEHGDRGGIVVKNVLAVCLLIALIESGVRLFRLVRGRPSDPPKIR